MLDLVHKLLSDNTDVVAEVSTRIFPFVREQDTPMPAIMMDFVNTQFSTPKDNLSTGDTYQVEIYTYASSATVAMRTGNKVRSALVNKSGDFNMTGSGGFTYTLIESRIVGMGMEVESDGKIYILVQVFDFVVSM